jgi:hypothetical protein
MSITMSTLVRRIIFARIVIAGKHDNKYAIVCPSCGKKSNVSGNVKDEAERDGKMIMPCCGKSESIYGKA